MHSGIFFPPFFFFYLEVSERPAVWARRRTGAGVGRRACRDMVWRRDLSSAAGENMGSPPVHTGTAGGRRGGLQRKTISVEGKRSIQ